MKTDTLRARLLDAQLDLAQCRERAVILLLTGHAVTYKGQLVNELNHWLENRHTEVHALGPSSEERERPYWWRFWRRLPADGRIAIFDRSWYGREMFTRTQAPGAEWALIACDDKRRARLAVLEEVNRRLEMRLASPH